MGRSCGVRVADLLSPVAVQDPVAERGERFSSFRNLEGRLWSGGGAINILPLVSSIYHWMSS